MDTIEFDEGVNIYCEVSGRIPRPLLPAQLRPAVIKAFHNLDHPGQSESLRRIAAQYYWPKQKTDMKHFARSCDGCQSAKPARTQNHFRQDIIFWYVTLVK